MPKQNSRVARPDRLQALHIIFLLLCKYLPPYEAHVERPPDNEDGKSECGYAWSNDRRYDQSQKQCWKPEEDISVTLRITSSAITPQRQVAAIFALSAWKCLRVVDLLPTATVSGGIHYARGSTRSYFSGRKITGKKRRDRQRSSECTHMSFTTRVLSICKFALCICSPDGLEEFFLKVRCICRNSHNLSA